MFIQLSLIDVILSQREALFDQFGGWLRNQQQIFGSLVPGKRRNKTCKALL